MARQLITDQITLDEDNGVKLLQERLTDGSKVYNVLIDREVMFYCSDYSEAIKLYRVLKDTDHSPLH